MEGSRGGLVTLTVLSTCVKSYVYIGPCPLPMNGVIFRGGHHCSLVRQHPHSMFSTWKTHSVLLSQGSVLLRSGPTPRLFRCPTKNSKPLTDQPLATNKCSVRDSLYRKTKSRLRVSVRTFVHHRNVPVVDLAHRRYCRLRIERN